MEFKKYKKKEFIVIVDDEPQVLRSLKWELEIAPLDEPLNIETFERTADAIEFITENSDNIFLLIADLRMPAPNLTGSDLLIYIHKLFPEIVLILLTAYSDLPEIQKAITAEIQALIFKPWTSSMLLAEIIKAHRLYRMRRENIDLQKRVQQQLEYAGDFQRRMLRPPELPSDGISLEFKYEPLSDYHCGGDYYDFISLNQSEQLVLIGDVAGHGIKPAFITAMLKIITTTVLHEMENFSASAFLTLINKKLCDALEPIDNIVVTFTVALIKKDLKKLSVAGAGNLPVYIFRDGKCFCLYLNDPAMGFNNKIVYHEQSFDLQRGDKLVLFTDGLVEIAERGEMINEDEVTKQFEEVLVSKSPAEAVFNRFRKYHSDGNYSDDVTIAVVTIEN